MLCHPQPQMTNPPTAAGYHPMQQNTQFTPLVLPVTFPTPPLVNGFPSPALPYQFFPLPAQLPQQVYLTSTPSPTPSLPMTAVYHTPDRFAMPGQTHPLMQEEEHTPNYVVNPEFHTPAWKRDPSRMDRQMNYQNSRNPQKYNELVGFRKGKGPMMQRVNPNYLSGVPRRAKKKFGFRSKQNMIDKVYLALVEKYEKRGLLAGDDEVLRGEDTIRLHVKKFKALQRIEEALQAAERLDSVTISRVSIPLSMKNQFQKKGFLVYVQVEKVWMVPLAQKIFRQFDEFKKCDVARHTTEATEAEAQTPTTDTDDNACVDAETNDTVTVATVEPINKKAAFEDDFDDLFTGPMVPQRSCGEMGQ